MKVIKITRKTTAKPEAIWELWANVPGRTRWDDSLEHIKIDSEFKSGAFGAVKLKGQPERKFEILDCTPMTRYTDRFFLPMGGKMDWIHTINELGDGSREVTFDVSVSGPTSFILGPIMKKVLKSALPPTVDKLVAVAEQAS